jgi:hypothetical protein
LLAAHRERDAVALPTIPSVGMTIAPGTSDASLLSDKLSVRLRCRRGW